MQLLQSLCGLVAFLAIPARSTVAIIEKTNEAITSSVVHRDQHHHVQAPDADQHAEDEGVHMINSRRHDHNEVQVPVDIPHGLTVSHGAHSHARALSAEQDSDSMQAKASLRRHVRRHEERSEAVEVPGPLPEHGFHGQPVAHEDMVTYTNDWREEYGPGAEDLTTYGKICAKYPDNEWCRMNGHHHNNRHMHVDHVTTAGKASSGGSSTAGTGDEEEGQGESSSATASKGEDAAGGHGGEGGHGGHGGHGGADGEGSGAGAGKKDDKGRGEGPFHPWFGGGGPGSGARTAQLSGVLGLAALVCHVF